MASLLSLPRSLSLRVIPLVSHWRGTLARIHRLTEMYAASTDEELKRVSLSLKYQALCGESLEGLLPQAFALVKEAARRATGLAHFDVQLLGGAVLFHRSIAEMQTGEGKTLTASLPLYLAALRGHGAHLATANDYLARRDAEFVRPIFELLGVEVGVVHSGSSRQERRRAYACDVTYGAAREFGFDFLRDRLHKAEWGHECRDLLGNMLGIPDPEANEQPLQRELHFMLVDEADSILIDEARTPLVVSSLPGSSQETAAAVYRWAARYAADFESAAEFSVDPQSKQATLTAAGRRRVRELPRPHNLTAIPLFDLYEHIELAIRVSNSFVRDQQYVLRDGEVVIVDENTGRLAEGRKWRDGIHQAIEAREGVDVTVRSGEAARVTVQHFFRLYDQLAGMTGTAISSRRELRRIYGLNTFQIPTHRPVRRRQLADRVFGNAAEKWAAVVAETLQVHQAGRPVLIGTRSIDTSEQLSTQLTAAGVAHEILNANRHAEEAEIVGAAGQTGRVTVATNMAGRGTDIKLGDGVAELGGLHVICTEYHDAQRIDRQLYGRCARQGDPGSVCQFAALDDEIVRTGFGANVAERYVRLGRGQGGEAARFAKLLRRAQARVEARHYRQRRVLLYHEQQRRKAQQEMGQDPYLDSTG